MMDLLAVWLTGSPLSSTLIDPRSDLKRLLALRVRANKLVLTATDLSNFLSCRHRTALEIAEARGKRSRPYRDDPLIEVLVKRGTEHERSYVDSLRSRGREVVDLRAHGDPDQAVAYTMQAMQAGTDIIVQGALCDRRWFGRPDVLLRVATASGLGEWSYEVADTKLARETRAGTIIQLGLYAELLALAQGIPPEYFHVVTPDSVNPRRTYRVDDYAAYVRLVRVLMHDVVSQDEDLLAQLYYPDPVDHCDVCPWFRVCDKKRHDDDHLSLIAGASRIQRRELQAHSILTLTAVARLPLPLPFKPQRGAVETLVQVCAQARVQLDSRGKSPPVYELRATEADKGLLRLPEPSNSDVFLDLEGDPFAAEGGREYLFGVATINRDGTPDYRSFWALSAREEREAFESVVDLIMAAWKADEGMHVYHYAPYEPSAFKRLMGRYVTREAEIDRLLRASRFVDLYTVVRQAARIGVERYSIKNLEPLYSLERTVPLFEASRCLRVIEQALELGGLDIVSADVRRTVEGYNQDDCISTLRLREWLEQLRTGAIAAGSVFPRPAALRGDASEAVDERTRRVEALRRRLLVNVPTHRGARSEEQQGRWLLAYLLDWHRREDKASWWEYYRLRDLAPEELLDEPQAVGGLEYVGRVKVVTNVRTGRPTGSVEDRYQFPAQEMEIGEKDELKLADGKTFGHVVEVDRDARTIDVRKGAAQADHHPIAAFAHTYVRLDVLEDAIYSIGEAVAGDGGITSGPRVQDAAARELLMARGPRLLSGAFRAEAPEASFAVRIVGDLDQTVLAIQGPPGSGKTYCGAAMIRELVGQGKKVGVTATSHKVIRNLLDAAAKVGTTLPSRGIRLVHKNDDDAGGNSAVATVDNNAEALRVLQTGEADVLGATAWLWARPEFRASVDVLFVDEAGQMALANVLAISRAASSLVLLGDPRQLEQPRRGSHPDGVNVSALQHILQEHLTIPPERGIFLPVTRRLAPSICSFTSQMFYESKLRANSGLERQSVSGTDIFDGSGLWIVEVEHDGNRNHSDDEVDVIAGLAARLTAPGARWTNEDGKSEQMTAKDVLVVSPYNAQVSRLTERLATTGVRVGTVDKFQGQEAPVVICSMATSRPEDAPRGMEFLYSLNRLNVATSRARCAAIIVASPKLFTPECYSPRQIKLANALCRFRELAHITRFPVGREADVGLSGVTPA